MAKVIDIVDREVALAEFDRFVEAMDLDVDMADMDSEDLTTFNKQKKRLITVLCNGSLVINENGEAVFAPSKSKIDGVLTFHERTGASLMAMDGVKKNHTVAMTYKVMADMTRTHPNTFAKLKGNDIKVCEAIFALLMDYFVPRW